MKAEIEVVRGDLILGTLPEGEAVELLRIGFFRRDDRFRRADDPTLRAMAELLVDGPAVNPGDASSPVPGSSGRSPSWFDRTRQSLSSATGAAGSVAAAGVGAVSNAAGAVAVRLRSFAGDAPSAVSKSTQSLLEGFLPQIRATLLKALAKAGDANTRALEAVRAGVRDDDFMRKTFGAVYDCLPKPVCRFVNEEKFVAFCLEHRNRLLEQEQD